MCIRDRLTGLQSKIALCKSNLFLFRISILCNQITGIAGQHIILDRSAPTLTAVSYTHLEEELTHIADINALKDALEPYVEGNKNIFYMIKATGVFKTCLLYTSRCV